MADEADVRGTEYLVLEKMTAQGSDESQAHGSNVWMVEREVTFARSAQDAIARHVRANGAKGGVFIAVPTRSWKQVTVATETQTRLTFT